MFRAPRPLFCRSVLRWRSPSCTANSSLIRAFGVNAEKIPHITQSDQVSPELQVMTGYLEHLDNVNAQAEKLRLSIKEFKDAHTSTTIKWMDTSDFEQFFVRAEAQQKAIDQQLKELNLIVLDGQKIFAVDAPDGETDLQLNLDLETINSIIADQALTEDVAAVEQRHRDEAEAQREAAKVYAVDASDGDVDEHVHRQEEIGEVQRIIDNQAILEDAELVSKQHELEEQDRLESSKIFAVDAPDGDVDDRVHELEEMIEVNHIIDDQAILEDAAAIKKKREQSDADRLDASKTYAVDAPDGTSDAHTQEEFEEIHRIFGEEAQRRVG